MQVSLGRGGRGSPAAAPGAPSGSPGAPGPAGRAGSGAAAAAGAWFSRGAAATANAVGTPWAFLAAAGGVAGWAVSGPLFGFSDTWQLVINTGTTIVTFLMVFLIQNTQNRDAKALHLKLDELLRAVVAARDDLIDVEEDTDARLDALQQTFRALRRHPPGIALRVLPAGGQRTGQRGADRAARGED